MTAASLERTQIESRRAIANGVDLRILPLGDSITFGEGSSDGNGYRLALSKRLTKRGNNVNFIGSVQSGTMANNDNEGHGGYQIIAVALTGKPDYPLRPNVVLFMAGTNDIVFDTELEYAPNRLGDIVQQIATECPDAAILVGTLTPMHNPPWNNKAITFNFAILDIIADLSQKGIHTAVVNMSETSIDLIHSTDGIHPTDEGYEKIAAAWYDGILAASEKGWIQKPLPSAPRTQAHEPNDQEMKIIESQPKPPMFHRPTVAVPSWASAHCAFYAVLALVLVGFARKAVGILLRRYRS